MSGFYISMNLRKISEHRAGIYLSLGSVIATGAVGVAAVMITGCGGEETTEEAVGIKGAMTVVRETEPGQFRIEDERVVDGESRLVVRYLDGREQTVSDPETFAQLLPATPPAGDSTLAFTRDSLLAAVPVDTGWSVTSGGTGVEGSGGSDGTAYRPQHGGGFPLGNILLMSMLMNAWRPAHYAGYYYRPSAAHYARPGAFRSALDARRSYGTFAGRGLAPRGAAEYRDMLRTRTASRTRVSTPSNPRGGFLRGAGRSGG